MHSGRSGEWSAVKEAHVRKQIAELIQFIECPKHKTDYKYGAAGKWLTPASWDAVKKFLELCYKFAGKPYCLFFEVPRVDPEAWEEQPVEDHKQVAIHTLARASGRVYAEEWEVMGVTLGRQFFSNAARPNHDDGEISRRAIASANMHTPEMAASHYESQSPENHAADVRATTLGVLGDHIAQWPSAEAIAEHIAKVSAEDVIKKFNKPKIKKSGNGKAVAEADKEHHEEDVANANEEHSEFGNGGDDDDDDDDGKDPVTSDREVNSEGDDISTPATITCGGEGESLEADVFGSGNENELGNFTGAELEEALATEISFMGGSLPASSNLGDGDVVSLPSASSGLHEHMAGESTAEMRTGTECGKANLEDEALSLDGFASTFLLLQQTISDYSEDDSLETAAAKAEHLAVSQVAVRVWAKEDPTISKGYGDVLKSLDPALKKSIPWSYPSQAEVAAPKFQPAAVASNAALWQSNHPQWLLHKSLRESFNQWQKLQWQMHEEAGTVAANDVSQSAPEVASKGKGSAKGRTTGKGKSQEDIDYYAIYDPPEMGFAVSKHAVSDEAHLWMEEQLADWQASNHAKPWDQPWANQWYHDKRIEAINLGWIPMENSWDVVRSWLKRKCLAAKVKSQNAD